MQSRPKILILDDDLDFLDVCQQMLATLPSNPEILTATSGTRALALLENESFSLLLTDLRMPNMDGFQVLAIVRRRLPAQRIVVMTGMVDEVARTRAYAMGIDLFVEKPRTRQETQLFFECIESMLERREQSGFRGVVEHKALADIVQMECLTQNSAVLKIASDKSIGYIWFLKGEIIDAATATRKGEAAFKEILSWKVGHFDLLPADPERVRTIRSSYEGLILDMAQSLDEADADQPAAAVPVARNPLADLARTPGVEFLLSQDAGSREPVSWSCEEPEALGAWAQRLLQGYRSLGDLLGLEGPGRVEGFGPQRHLAVATDKRATLVVGFEPTFSEKQVRSAFNEVLTRWGS